MMTVWVLVIVLSASGWIVNGLRESAIAQCMGEEVQFTDAVMRPLFAAVSLFIYNTPSAKVYNMTFGLLLLYYAINIFWRVRQIGALEDMRQDFDGTKCHNIRELALSNQFWIIFMIVRDFFSDVLYGVNSTVEIAIGKRVFNFFLNTYLDIFEDIYASQ